MITITRPEPRIASLPHARERGENWDRFRDLGGEVGTFDIVTLGRRAPQHIDYLLRLQGDARLALRMAVRAARRLPRHDLVANLSAAIEAADRPDSASLADLIPPHPGSSHRSFDTACWAAVNAPLAEQAAAMNLRVAIAETDRGEIGAATDALYVARCGSETERYRQLADLEELVGQTS